MPRAPERNDGPATHAEAHRARKDLVSGEVLSEDRLIRFVAGPDGQVVPDLARKLPGRGMWVAADRASIETAVRKGGFSRSAKTRLAAAPDLADQVERLLVRRCLDQLGLAKREGVLISGFEKTLAAIRGGRAGWLVEASDGSSDGRRKTLTAAARARPPVPVCGAFTADELGLALGGVNVIHVCLLAGRRAERWTEEVRRLAGFRPLLPLDWREEARTGGADPAPSAGVFDDEP
jgi:predicted RNA-binding protein YlxR (DUF448 family)